VALVGISSHARSSHVSLAKISTGWLEPCACTSHHQSTRLDDGCLAHPCSCCLLARCCRRQCHDLSVDQRSALDRDASSLGIGLLGLDGLARLCGAWAATSMAASSAAGCGSLAPVCSPRDPARLSLRRSMPPHSAAMWARRTPRTRCLQYSRSPCARLLSHGCPPPRRRVSSTLRASSDTASLYSTPQALQKRPRVLAPVCCMSLNRLACGIRALRLARIHLALA
jgi:hypothetical protein